MARPPFTSNPASPATAMPTPPSAGAAPGAPGAPGARPGMPPMRGPRDPADRRTLVVGRGISVQGTVQDAERLIVEGTVESNMIHATELSISIGGVFKGEVEVEDAEVAGTIDGTLTARGSLIVRATGRVLGTARCRRLQVEDGGQITGRIEMITEPAKPEAPRSAAPSPSAEPSAAD
ncbi:MAG: polymer-forming cytoskeletal protein [Proteobacteria bacterium]|nr:polymer-forming cytoskeletal protein [Pseudomonadota bacterium]